MAKILVIGGGMGGLSTALLLAGDGHDVTVLERDPAPPPATGDEAWDYVGAQGRQPVPDDPLLPAPLPPDRRGRAARRGARRSTPTACCGSTRSTLAPAEMTGGHREGDERFEAMTGRRPMVEAAFARTADGHAERHRAPRRRGEGPADRATPVVDGVPHVVGVVTDAGEELRADLVVDATGRRSALPSPARRRSAPVAPIEELEDSRLHVLRPLLPLARRHRCRPALGPPLQHYDSVSVLTLPADNGTWGIGIVTSAGDADLRPARDVADVGARSSRGYPLIAHWLDGEPITDVELMAKIEDRHRMLRRRRRAGRHRRRPGRRLVGLHQPVGRPGRLDRAHARAGPARPDPRPGPRRPGVVRPGLARHHRTTTVEPLVPRHARLRPPPPGRDRGPDRRRALRDRRPGLGHRQGHRGRRGGRTPTSSGASSTSPACWPGPTRSCTAPACSSRLIELSQRADRAAPGSVTRRAARPARRDLIHRNLDPDPQRRDSDPCASKPRASASR